MKCNLIIAAFVLLFTIPSFSQDTGFLQNRDWILLGLETGYVEKDSVESPEVTNSGIELGVRGAYARYYTDWLFDLGFGWRSDSMKKNSVDINTRALFAELTARYRMNENWSVGPVLTSLIGKDVSYSDEGTNSDDRSVSTFLGARVMYDTILNQEQNLLRVGLQAQTDIDIRTRQVSWVQLLVEFAWPFSRSEKSSVRSAPIRSTEGQDDNYLKFNLTSTGLRFAVDSSNLVGKSNKVIEEVVEVLLRYQNEWTSVLILGHTDISGDYRKNVQLSRDRAEAVLRAMQAKGLERVRLTAIGYGPDQPLDSRDTDEAYAKNRRVELQIMSSNPSVKFVNDLNSVAQAH